MIATAIKQAVPPWLAQPLARLQSLARGLHDRLRPNSAGSHGRLARAALGRADSAAALRHFERAAAGGASEKSGVHLQLGLLHAQSGDFEQAEVHLGIHVEATEGTRGGLEPLAEILARQGRHDEVIALAEDALKRSPELSWLRFHLGKSLQALARDDEAVEQLLIASANPEIGFAAGGDFNMPNARAVLAEPELLERWKRRALAEKSGAGFPVGVALLENGDADAGAALIRSAYQSLPLLSSVREENWESQTSLKPAFLILGPAKTGSTTLFAWLAAHPDVVPPPRKEIEFWVRRGERDPSAYVAYFAPLNPAAGFVTGEASVGLLHQTEVIDWMVENCPDVKTLVLHREPLARAWSHHRMRSRPDSDGSDFVDLVAEVVGTGLDWRDLDPGTVFTDSRFDDARDSRHVVAHGLILFGLRRWHAALGSEQVRLVRTRDLRERPVDTLHQVQRYLGLSEHTPADMTDRNMGRHSSMPESAIDPLKAFYADHEVELDQFVATHRLDLWAS